MCKDKVTVFSGLDVYNDWPIAVNVLDLEEDCEVDVESSASLLLSDGSGKRSQPTAVTRNLYHVILLETFRTIDINAFDEL